VAAFGNGVWSFIFLVVDGVTELQNEDPDGMDLTAGQLFGTLPPSLAPKE